ncbi:MAG: DEAD/DEAH box helicase [Desulfobacter sp.]|nr:DEAD/DEAH box helicase [Desulfobacter sp.]WDP85340.1 MAG: DEAD/DEAH box helicase [Desulfobacter sp.]
MSFNELGLRAELLKAVKSKGYKAPTPIQTRVIPVILNNRDVLARAQTGTGKTDAFALPLVDLLSREQVNKRHPRVLVLAPTRELALQVGESFKAYGRRVSIRCTVVYGGVNIAPQIDRLKRGIDILVATPGRLLDLAEHRSLDLSHIEFLVFDEADRMLDLGFKDEISQVLQQVPQKRRTMLFSATYTQEIRDLAKIMLDNPEFIEVEFSQKTPKAIEQQVHLVEQTNKRALLIHLIIQEGWTQALVFVRTKHGANKLTEKLAAKKISAAALHGNKSQSFRTRTLKEFKSGKIRILVATDVAARGLDITQLPQVVNYDMPGAAEDYIHRIGRTGRAGVRGMAISLVSLKEKPQLKAVEKLLGYKIPRKAVSGFTHGEAVPDFVLLRPNDETSERKADKKIKALVKERNAKKKSPGPKLEKGKPGKSKKMGTKKRQTQSGPTSTSPKKKDKESRSRRPAKKGRTRNRQR